MPPPSILATAVVPWTPGFTVDHALFQDQVAAIANGLTRAIYVFGTAGEGYAVTEKQFDEIAGLFWESARVESVSPILGVVSLSLPTVVERIRRGRAMGFRQFQISLPAWGALLDHEVDRFFAETCGQFPDCSFNHYNLMRTKRLLTGKDYLRITERHPNLVAAKCSTSDPAMITELLTASSRLRFYFTEFGYTIARRMGADCGLLVSLGCAHYPAAKAFVAGSDSARDEACLDLKQMVASLTEIATGRFHIDGAYDKMLIRLNLPNFPLRLLTPYEGPTEQEFDRFRDSLPPRWRA